MSRKHTKLPHAHRDGVDWFKKQDSSVLRFALMVAAYVIAVIFLAQLAYDLGLAG